MKCVQSLNNQRLLAQLKLSGRYPSLQRTIRTGSPSEVKLIPQTTSLNKEESELVDEIRTVLSHADVHREITKDISDVGKLRIGDKFEIDVYSSNEESLKALQPKPNTILLISFVKEERAILELFGQKSVLRCSPGRKKSLLKDFTVTRHGKTIPLARFLRKQGLPIDPFKVFNLSENGGIILHSNIENPKALRPPIKKHAGLDENGKWLYSSLKLNDKDIKEEGWMYHIHPLLYLTASPADLHRSLMNALMTKVFPIIEEPTEAALYPEIIFDRIGRGVVYIPDIKNIAKGTNEMREAFKNWGDVDDKTLIEFGEKLEKEFFIKVKISGFELR